MKVVGAKTVCRYHYFLQLKLPVFQKAMHGVKLEG